MNTLNSPDQASIIDRALSYPYPQLDHSFTLLGSKIQPLPADFWPAGRLPVIACGSNAAPEQLLRKFGDIETDPIYVTRAKLSGFVCCYSAHISVYGSIPATLAPYPDYMSDCHVTWLTEAQLDHMHKTEAVGSNYRFSMLSDITLNCEKRGRITEAYAYIGLHGNLQVDGSPILVSNAGFVTTTPLLHLTQIEIQKWVIASLAPEKSVEEFVLSNITQSDLRRDRIEKLRQTALGFTYPHEKVILS